MKTRKPEYVEKGHPGVWPDGEPQAPRDAYDRLLAEQILESPRYTVERLR